MGERQIDSCGTSGPHVPMFAAHGQRQELKCGLRSRRDERGVRAVGEGRRAITTSRANPKLGMLHTAHRWRDQNAIHNDTWSGLTGRVGFARYVSGFARYVSGFARYVSGFALETHANPRQPRHQPRWSWRADLEF
eukprot:1195979-Prorocentrum_minimum.AAC.6